MDTPPTLLEAAKEIIKAIHETGRVPYTEMSALKAAIAREKEAGDDEAWLNEAFGSLETEDYYTDELLPIFDIIREKYRTRASHTARTDA